MNVAKVCDFLSVSRTDPTLGSLRRTSVNVETDNDRTPPTRMTSEVGKFGFYLDVNRGFKTREDP